MERKRLGRGRVSRVEPSFQTPTCRPGPGCRRAGAWPTGPLRGPALSQLLDGSVLALFTICNGFIYFSFLSPLSPTRLSAPSGQGGCLSCSILYLPPRA